MSQTDEQPVKVELSAVAGTAADSKTRKCEYLGCNEKATTITNAIEYDRSVVQYKVCSSHVGQMDYITLDGN